EEALAEELKSRHGERVVLIEARTGADGRLRVLAVLDVDGEAIAAEAARHGARAAAGGVVLDVVDRASWIAMQRLAASGMIVMTQAETRVLHQSPELATSA